ncbi:MAG TPA: hypothetical protein VFA48_13565 [Gammaproteobacteria bacterium]|nr:hypothetical protein [Gammaproteobacteria bacterium]
MLLSLGLVTACASGPARASPPATSRPATYAIAAAVLITSDTLKLRYNTGYIPCYGKLVNVMVKQDAWHVTITLQRVYPQPYDSRRLCPQYLVAKWITVRLDRPLGNRTVIDGSTGKKVDVRQ